MKKFFNLSAATLIVSSLTLVPGAMASPKVDVPKILKENPGLKYKVLRMALNAYDYALEHGKVKRKNILTVVDFTKPSYDNRMWVINLEKNKVLFKTPVAHGKGSGTGVMATHFSNAFHSHASSPGIYTTLNTYSGHHGYSLRLNGLERGINNHALARDIVMHSAWYMKPGFIHAHHYAGHSWGCFALSPTIYKRVISNIKGGSVLFAYARSENHDPLVDNLHTPTFASKKSNTDVADNQKVVSNSHSDA